MCVGNHMLVIHILYTGGVDYEAGPYYVNIAKGNMSAPLCINIIDNNNLENGKFFTLRMNTTALHPEIIPLPHASAMISILDDECKNININ